MPRWLWRALRAGKHVFVEKPLCLNSAELATIADFYASGEQGKPLLMTGFNRRFSPSACAIAQKTAAADQSADDELPG